MSHRKTAETIEVTAEHIETRRVSGRKSGWGGRIASAAYDLAALAIVLAFMLVLAALTLVALPLVILSVAIAMWFASRAHKKARARGQDPRGWTIVSFVRPDITESRS